MPKPPPPTSPFWKLWEVGTRVNIGLFRATGGRVGGSMGRGQRILLLHHKGAKSGKERVSPLLYMPDGDDIVIVASKGGVDKHPAWYHNLRAHPDTEVELRGRERRRVRARVVSDEAERERLWPMVVDMYKGYADYQSYTDRKIPLVVLERAAVR
jgi:deazaflavin-dependent oxidoreductase (nitroreductase family)